ncbi:putative vacuolar membrane protein YML018C [Ceratocystis fimbriata CBS 114723]|uniref:Putative vacuolar membrane protein YML018C n=1 Tax=Ceratocystis fimbriata CBS 114723 TaxID=1035309 RepID=A0A2C5X4P0_9PEZI|nr:putative vacuolar membrane protein YML018C [Ceratocystis fimbriata CBS 114723]
MADADFHRTGRLSDYDQTLRTRSPSVLSGRSEISALAEAVGLGGLGRRTLGISLLMVTVILWTCSNFMASSIFSDATYDKPFFVVYVNTSIFALYLVPSFVKFVYKHGLSGLRIEAQHIWAEYQLSKKSPSSSSTSRFLRLDNESSPNHGLLSSIDDIDGRDSLDRLPNEEDSIKGSKEQGTARLSMLETLRLAAEFALLWFFANYFSSACLQYTSVGSATILSSTSSVWTLAFCALFRVEGFTRRKLFGVLTSLAGVILVSTVDLSGSRDEDRGSFPHKSQSQIAIGDAMAFTSAIVYGMYVTVMKGRVGNEERVNMPLFFGFVGVLNLVFLWPGFFILHWTGMETFVLPPTGRIWSIVLINSMTSFLSDISWAFAMLLTTPLVVTVGISLTIPLSLIGEMVQYQQHAPWVYWVGAAVVFMSFLFINNESHDDDDGSKTATGESMRLRPDSRV